MDVGTTSWMLDMPLEACWVEQALETCFENLPSPFGRGAGGEGGLNCIAKNRSALTLTLFQRERGLNFQFQNTFLGCPTS